VDPGTACILNIYGSDRPNKERVVTYWQYWRFNGPPFSADYSRPLFMGPTVEEAVARIEFLINNRRSVGALMGPCGVGKSSVLRYCHSNPSLSPQNPCVQIGRLSMMGLQAGELHCWLASWVTGNAHALDKAIISWKLLCDYFKAAQREGMHTVLLIDDTESSSAAAEADLCRLMSMSFPLTIIFSAETHLASAISRDLIDRVELQIELPAWDFSQTADFLIWTGKRLGRPEPIFTESAVQRIHQLSGGIARKITQLADLSLVAGAVTEASYIDAGCVDQVAWELPKSYAA
jgi:general secretion pathway protein A